MTQQLASEFAGAVLDLQLGTTSERLQKLLPRLSKTDQEAVRTWVSQVENLSVTDQEVLGRQLRRGKRLLAQMQQQQPGAPPPPPPPGPPPPGRLGAAPAPAVPKSELMAAIQRAGMAALRKRKCALLPGDRDQLELLGKFILRGPDAARLVKKGFNPVDVAMMNPSQRKVALKSDAPKCYTAPERISELADNPFSYQLADQCYPMDAEQGEYPSLEACRRAAQETTSWDNINKFLDVAYGDAMTGPKMKFLKWMMEEQSQDRIDPITLWQELRDSGIQNIKRAETVYDQVISAPIQRQIEELLQKQKTAPPVQQRILDNQIESLRRDNTRLEEREVMIQDTGAQRTMARRFFQQQMEGTTGEEEDPLTAMAAENQRLRETIENLRTGKITETEMEASQQRYLGGEIDAAHVPGLKAIDQRVQQLEQAEHVDATQVTQLREQVATLWNAYQDDHAALTQKLASGGTDKTYHDYIVQTVQQQIDTDTPSVGRMGEIVVESAAFRRAMRRRKK